MEPRATPPTNAELSAEISELRQINRNLQGQMDHFQELLPFLTIEKDAVERAVIAKKPAVITTLAKMKSNVNGYWKSSGVYKIPLYDAIEGNCKEVVKALIDAKANPNAQGDSYYRGTPLFFAARNEHQSIAQILIEAKASPDQALLSATRLHQPKAIRMLVEKLGADIDCIDKQTDETPLQIAKRLGNKVTLKLLVKLGADIYASNMVSTWPWFQKSTEELLDWQFEGLYERALARDEKYYQSNPKNPGLDKILEKINFANVISPLIQKLQDQLKDYGANKAEKYAVLEACYWVQLDYYKFTQSVPNDFHAIFTFMGMSDIIEQNQARAWEEQAPRQTAGPTL